MTHHFNDISCICYVYEKLCFITFELDKKGSELNVEIIDKYKIYECSTEKHFIEEYITKGWFLRPQNEQLELLKIIIMKIRDNEFNFIEKTDNYVKLYINGYTLTFKK